MKKTIILLTFLSFVIFLNSCEETSIETVNLSYEFTFNWNGTPITLNDFNEKKYTNKHGENLSITKLRFLISNITFIKGDGSKHVVKGYNLVDLTNSEGLIYNPNYKVEVGDYEKITFTFGFDTIDNKKNYLDLNSVNWNWPKALGGGYHFMQYEGKFIDSIGLEQPYALHIGTARVSQDVFEPNHFDVDLGEISIEKEATIEIKMNIAEWFKNPYEWDLNKYSAPLMPNYDAQILMNKNGKSIFKLGLVK